jgi:hypothetical protein
MKQEASKPPASTSAREPTPAGLAAPTGPGPITKKIWNEAAPKPAAFEDLGPFAHLRPLQQEIAQQDPQILLFNQVVSTVPDNGLLRPKNLIGSANVRYYPTTPHPIPMLTRSK